METIRCRFCGGVLNENDWDCECGAKAYVDWGWDLGHSNEKPVWRFYAFGILALFSHYAAVSDRFWWWVIQIAMISLYLSARRKIKKLVSYKKKTWYYPKQRVIAEII